MELRNKKTGEIIDIKDALRDSDDYPNHYLISNGWEDYEEPKIINEIDIVLDAISEYCEEHSYYSGDLEKIKILNIVEDKLKAFKRLKDKGFRFEGIKQDYTRFNQQKPMRDGRKYLQFNKAEDEEWLKENWEDLDLLFGGEE